jgi:hypothetical protein
VRCDLAPDGANFTEDLLEKALVSKLNALGSDEHMLL